MIEKKRIIPPLAATAVVGEEEEEEEMRPGLYSGVPVYSSVYCDDYNSFQ